MWKTSSCSGRSRSSRNSSSVRMMTSPLDFSGGTKRIYSMSVGLLHLITNENIFFHIFIHFSFKSLSSSHQSAMRACSIKFVLKIFQLHPYSYSFQLKNDFSTYQHRITEPDLIEDEIFIHSLLGVKHFTICMIA